MCYRSVLTTPKQAVIEWFNAVGDDVPEQPPRRNIRPTQPLVAVRSANGQRRLSLLRWAFTPHWYKALNDGPPIMNARAETIAAKPAFADAVRHRRCLIPADGYYEWTSSEDDGGKDPWFIHAAGGQVMGFAGIWQAWRSPDGVLYEGCAIVTTAANARMSNLHARMPLVISPENYALWLGEAGHGAARLMQPGAEELLDYHRVDRAINGAKTDDRDFTRPLIASGNPRATANL